MDVNKLKKLLNGVKSGRTSPEEAFTKLRSLPFEDLGFAKVDHHRSLRKGFPEVVFCQGKSKKQILNIVKSMAKAKTPILATRADRSAYAVVKKAYKSAKYHSLARIVTIGSLPSKKGGNILILTGGTADLPVAEEAAVTAEFLGNNVEQLYDVGVAGLHRLLKNSKKLYKSNVLIVIAGMEGALASVVAGLVSRPVIAVPTSVGYGASFKGLSALLSMLNSCSPGVAVVNIDNGFGAGVLAHMINSGS